MLIKGMVPAVEPHQTVWVVDPPARAAGDSADTSADSAPGVVSGVPVQPGRLCKSSFSLFLIQIAVGCDTSGSAEDLPERNKKMEIKVVQNTSRPMIR